MPLAVLTYLAQHPERVVAVEELRQAVWGSTYVSRTTIRVCVREVRQALGDETGHPALYRDRRPPGVLLHRLPWH